MTEKTRKRGGVSMPCPKCRSNSRVLKTRRAEHITHLLGGRAETIVTRDRECLKKKHRFKTIEAIAHE